MQLFICILAICLISPIYEGTSFAQVKPERKENVPLNDKQMPLKFNIGDFTYTSANRRDPFEALFLKDIKQQSGRSTALKKGYELEELKLVGIMKADNKNLAMMEDMQSKGIIFKKNDFLNKNLWITEILSDKVEFGYKIKGEIKTFTIEIPRKKEGM
jgi:Tfp pilus assembly protein PilP